MFRRANRFWLSAWLTLILFAFGSVVGCEDTELAPTDNQMDQVPPRTAAQPEPAEQEAVEEAAPDVPEEAEALEYEDEDFVELDVENRDPFRSFATLFTAVAAAPAQRRVLMSETSVDDMRLIAIVTGIPQPRAMFTDAGNVGHVVKRGDYIGRPEVIEAGGSESMPITLNWRVERIRPAELVLSREDPAASDEPPLTRVVPLHERDQD